MLLLVIIINVSLNIEIRIQCLDGIIIINDRYRYLYKFDTRIFVIYL